MMYVTQICKHKHKYLEVNQPHENLTVHILCMQGGLVIKHEISKLVSKKFHFQENNKSVQFIA